VQIETLRESAVIPRAWSGGRLHGARANALLQRGLIELAHVSGQTVRRISASGRELLHHLDAAGGTGRRAEAQKATERRSDGRDQLGGDALERGGELAQLERLLHVSIRHPVEEIARPRREGTSGQ